MDGRRSPAVLAMLFVLAVGTSPALAQTSKRANRGPRAKEAPVADPAETTQDPDKPAPKDDPATPTPKGGEGDKPAPKLEKATFANGCFWCTEAVFERVPGVRSAVSGYTGGFVPNPTYEQVCTGQTGHAEAVQLVYDASLVSYDRLLKIFFETHDPTTLNRQGPDSGTQYRSAIFAHDDAQRKAAERFINQLTAARAFAAPIVTQVEPLEYFFPAEPYHQDYFKKHPNAPYCRIYIAPKLRKLKVK